MNTPEKTDQPVFRIGIAMAGAVSAGAYTAGVIDYLLEALERWDRAKARNRELGPDHPDYDPSVPMHDVVIDVIGGASAGGMTAAITSLALFEGIRPVNDDNPQRQNNKLYDAWVNLNDHQRTTLQQMFAVDDIREGKVPSMLNSTPIDAIADRAKVLSINRDTYSPDWPAYISRDLELILTICSLRGIPIEIDFGAADSGDQPSPGSETPAEKPAHKMYLHKGIAHFTIDPTRAQLDHLLRLNPRIEDDKNIVIECAKATGAFPIGLRPRQFHNLSHAYLRGQIQRMFGKEINIRWNRIPKPFSFTAIDGGTINNEPFDDVLRVLEERHAADHADGSAHSEEGFKNYAILMIDPFPNFEQGENQEEYQQPDSIEKAVPQILSAIRRQAMIKEGELTRGFTGDYTRAMVFPVRRQQVAGDPGSGEQRAPYPIACGALDGFGGFFSRHFREHDFYLGRKNCQSFLRKHFSLRPDQVFTRDEAGNDQVDGSLFRGWAPGDPRYERFHYRKDNNPHFPIIPDLRVYQANSDDSAENGSLPTPVYPAISLDELKTLKKPLRRRVRKVLLTMTRSMVSPKKKEAPSEADPLTEEVRRTVNHHLGDPWLGRLLLWITLAILAILLIPLLPVFLVLALLLGHVAINFITRKIFGSIVYDFKKRGLLR